MDAFAFVRMAGRLQVGAVQICENIPLLELAPDQLTELSELCQSLNIEVELGLRGANSSRIFRYLELSKILRSQILRVVLTEEPTPPPLDDFAQVFAEVRPFLEESGVTLAIENHFDYSPSELAEFVSALSDPLLRICLDPLNSITILVGVEETIRTLLPYTVSAHLKNVVINRLGSGFWIQGAPLEEGLMDVRSYIRSLRSNGSCPHVFLESWSDLPGSNNHTIEHEYQRNRADLNTLNRFIDE